MDNSNGNEKFYTIRRDPSMKFTRFIFEGNCEYTQYEENKYKNLISLLSKDHQLNKKLDKYSYRKILKENIFNKKHQCMRYLNMFNYNVELTVKHFIKMIDAMNLFQIQDFSNIERSEKMGILLEYGLIGCITDESQTHPMITIDFTKYSSILNYISSSSFDSVITFVNMLIHFLNSVITTHLVPEINEQFDILIDFNGLAQNDFIPHFDTLTSLIQYLYPSRAHLIVIYAASPSSYSSFVNIHNNFLDYNREKIIMYDPSLNKIDSITQNLVNDFFLNKTKQQDYALMTNEPSPILQKNCQCDEESSSNIILFKSKGEECSKADYDINQFAFSINHFKKTNESTSSVIPSRGQAPFFSQKANSFEIVQKNSQIEVDYIAGRYIITLEKPRDDAYCQMNKFCIIF